MNIKYACIVQYYPLYKFPLFEKMGQSGADCPVLDKWWGDSFSFPWWAGIDDKTIAYLTESLKSAIKKLKEQ